MAVRHVITARGQTLHVDVSPVVQNGLNSDEIELRLGPAWDGLSLVLTLGAGSDAVQVIYGGAPVSIPAALMYEVGWLPVTVTGYDEDGRVRMVSACAAHLLKVVPSGYYDGTGGTDGDGEDLLGQLVGAYEDAVQAAQAAQEAADRANEAAESVGSGEGGTGVRGTQISLGEGDPKLGGIEGDSYIDSLTGGLWEYEHTEEGN